MALQKQAVNVSFASGVDTKTDPKQVMPGKLLTLQNGTFTSPGKIQKRNGFVELAAVSNANSLATFDDEILAISDTQVQSLDEGTSTLINKGPIAFAGVSLKSIVSNTNQQTTQDMSLNPLGITVFAWEDSSGGARYSVLDSITSNLLQNDALLSSTAVCPKVITLNNITFIFYIDTNTNSLKYKYIVPAMPTQISAAFNIVSVKTTNQVFDVALRGSRIFIAYVASGGHASITYLDSNMHSPLTPTDFGQTVSGPITVFVDNTINKIYTAFSIGTAVHYAVTDSNLVILLAATNIETISNVRNITGVISNGSGQIFYEIPAAITYNSFLHTALFSNGTAGSPSVFVRSVGLGTKAFFQNGAVFVCGIYDSGLGQQLSTTTGAPQNKYFVFNATGNAVGKLLAEPNTAGSLTAKDTLPSVNTLDGITYSMPLLLNIALTGFAFQLNQTLARVDLNFVADSTKVELGDNLHIAAGMMLFMYDGAAVVEHGFNLYPEPPTSLAHDSGGGLSQSVYQWVATYEWNDNKGQLHKSAPSVVTMQDQTLQPFTPISFTASFATGVTSFTVSSVVGLFVGQVLVDTTTGGNLQAGTLITSIVGSVLTIDLPTSGTSAGDTIQASNVFSADITIPTLRVSSKTGVQIVIYRTQATGENFFRVGSVPNNPAVNTVTFTDTLSDYSINFNEQLYTNGGAFPNIAMPATGIITQYQNRLVAIPAENQFQLMYSKQTGRSTGSALLAPVEFAALEFFINYDQRGGPGTALSPLDDKLVIAKENSFFFMYGQGPAPNGTNNDFSTPQLITTDCGCTDPASMVIMPSGLMFKSSKGIYLLERNLQTTYIGAPVESFNTSNVTSAQLIPNTNQVRFSLDDGQTILVYDYFVGQWSTFTTLNATDSVIAHDTYVYLDNELAALFQETPGMYTDNGKPISILIKTSWLSFAGFQGFQRVYKMMMSGDYFSPHTLEVKIAYDFNSTITQSTPINTQSFVQYPYGTDFTFGATSPEGGESPEQYQFRIFNQVQKCETIQVTLQEFPLVPYGQGLSISGLAFEVGAKKGLFKLPASRSVGS